MTSRSLVVGILSATWLLSVLFLGWIPEQDQFELIFPVGILAFASYLFLAFKSSEFSLKWFLLLAIVARIGLIAAFPNLSDDIYRFIWDGRLLHAGIHPYSILPTEVTQQNPLFPKILFEQLNSKGYYSIYPPIPQFIFWLSTIWPSADFLLENSIMKTIHTLFDIGTIGILTLLLKKFGLNQKRVLLYALNPLVIIELTGNLHHEGIVLFFLLVTVLYISRHRFLLAGIFFACAIATKILPLMFFPVLFFFIKDRGRWFFFMGTTLVTLLFFLPLFMDMQIISNISSSADLYIRKFEFNASIYYVLREIGFWVKGFNTIHILGPGLMGIATICILMISIIPMRRKLDFPGLFLLMMSIYLVYALLSITLHPWYIIMLVPFCLFTPYRTPIIWSGLIIMTYINYSFTPYQEQLWVVFFEYLVVFYFWYLEYRKHGWSLVTQPLKS